MTRITLKLEKRDNVLEGKLKRLKKTKSLCSQTGWFGDQGHHLQDPNEPTYPELANIHADGLGVEKRDVFSIAEFHFPLEANQDIAEALAFFLDSNEDVRELFQDLGEIQEDILRDIMGNPRYLPVTTNETPLVLTGDFKEALTTRVKRNV